MSKSRNGTTETVDTAEESTDQAVESAVGTLLEAAEVVDEALTEDKAEAPVMESIAEVLEVEIEEEKPSRRRRIARSGTIVLVTAAVAVAIGVAIAMILRRRGAEDIEEELLA